MVDQIVACDLPVVERSVVAGSRKVVVLCSHSGCINGIGNLMNGL